MINWGRKGLLLGAIAVTFVSPVSTTTTVKQVSVTPSHKVEVRHVTQPSSTGIKQASVKPNNRLETRHVTPTEITTGIKRASIRPSYKLEYRHITPTSEIVEPDTNGYYGTGLPKQNKDDDIIPIIIAIYESGAFD